MERKSPASRSDAERRHTAQNVCRGRAPRGLSQQPENRVARERWKCSTASTGWLKGTAKLGFHSAGPGAIRRTGLQALQLDHRAIIALGSPVLACSKRAGRRPTDLRRVPMHMLAQVLVRTAWPICSRREAIRPRRIPRPGGRRESPDWAGYHQRANDAGRGHRRLRGPRTATRTRHLSPRTAPRTQSDTKRHAAQRGRERGCGR